jgi:energy-coupling factor transport system ATP-binding protein
VSTRARTRGTCRRASGSRWCWRCSSTAAPAVLLLDEPTRGLDYAAKAALTTVLRAMAARAGVAVSTHDVEFVASTCDRVVVMAEGEVVADGTTADVVLVA